jgi:hypothetical protein
MTKLFRIPKEKPRAKVKAVTLAECRKVAKQVDPTAKIGVYEQNNRAFWVAADSATNSNFASVEHKQKSVALRALHAALTVLAGAK